jgi:hypothetical protein
VAGVRGSGLGARRSTRRSSEPRIPDPVSRQASP